ncbi:MAG: hypothetical protein CL761_03315 [Chloroflexi bacterium]|nr:hypothetical protein [Chloroflexota bacterium]|tara:strand:- start:242 stop:853 length:612 start_codon:yes stop_codon:yes gene_type:complete
MSKIRVQEIEHTASSNTNPAIALNANNNVTFDAGVTATSFTGDGANLTNVPAPSTYNAANLTGTIPNASVPNPLPAIDGSALTGTTDATKLPLTGGTLTGSVTFEDAINETVYTITDGASVDLDPDNGMIQQWTLGANRTATESLSAGQSVMLMVSAGSYTLTFPTITWVGGSAPTLATSGYTVIELWKTASTLYGATVGDVA